ncbi:hypothetical protein B0O99DRAFT_87134 [Bisporella sp. PMI_857]|nr:hypothetical protein B0O99DRAFT_87134 [Bisporella sp. PMI_857]
MESRSLLPPHMELFESQSNKPQPLRIIKRSQTITGGSCPTEIYGRGTSGVFDESFNVGSPPFGADRPLTVHKLRKKRPSILYGSFDDVQGLSSANALSHHSQTPTSEDDLDLTPKASKPVPRTLSAGAFLRSELHRGGSDIDNPFLYQDVPERRPVKSKNFILKAIGGRGSARVKNSSRCATGSAGRRVSGHSVTSTCFYEDSTSETRTQPAHVLCPEIEITPEVPSVESACCILWVAVSITGKLRRADGKETNEPVSSFQTNHGILHSMHIELFPGRDCSIPEIIGNLHELKIVGVGQTILVLVKVRLGNMNIPTPTGSDGLIADLESQLGDAETPYINVRITYRHCGFSNTIMQTDATGTIKRRKPQSVWSAADPRILKGPANPVITLIESHFPVDQARHAIHKLADDRIHIPAAKRQRASQREAIYSSVNTAKAIQATPLAVNNIPSIGETRQGSHNLGGWPGTPSFVGNTRISGPEIDPARKIWTEMRRNSQGRHHRATLGLSTFQPLDTNIDGFDNISEWIKHARLSPERERERIREIALKNKRSVGQDTLRSMAPSLKKGSTGTLGFGGAWGWTGWW